MLQEAFDVAVDHARDRDPEGRSARGGLCMGRECNEQDRGEKRQAEIFHCGLRHTTKAAMVADSRGEAVHGLACAAVSAFCIACSSFNTSRSRVDSSALAPSDLASLGLS